MPASWSIIASVVYASEWASVGGPPLLRSTILARATEQARLDLERDNEQARLDLARESADARQSLAALDAATGGAVVCAAAISSAR